MPTRHSRGAGKLRGLAVKMLVNVPLSPMRVLGFSLWPWLLTPASWEAAVMSPVFGSLWPPWETWMEFLTPGFSPAQPWNSPGK